MTSDTGVEAEANSVNQAIDALRPGLLRLRLIGAAAIIATAVISIFLANWIGHSAAGEPMKGVMWSLGIGVFVIIAVFGQIRKRHEILIMPILAGTVGLSHEKGAQSFLAGLPARLLPKHRTIADDLLSGEIGGRHIQFGEVKVETGGKNSSTLFDGLVISFPVQAQLVDFFLADEKETKGFLIFSGRIKVDDLVWQRSAIGASGRSYGLWARQDLGEHQERLVPILNAISTIENSLGGGASLYSASCERGQIHLAIRHRRNLFKIGGLLSGEAQLTADLRNALHELDLPMRLVTNLLAAEQAFLSAARAG